MLIFTVQTKKKAKKHKTKILIQTALNSEQKTTNASLNAKEYIILNNKIKMKKKNKIFNNFEL